MKAIRSLMPSRLASPWHRSLGITVLLAAALVAATPAHSDPAKEQELQSAAPKQQRLEPSPSLVQRLRRLLNLSPPLAVGGSRSGHNNRPSVCLISPWPTSAPKDESLGQAIVPTSVPTLFAMGELNEIQLIRGDRVAWQQRATSTVPISDPIAWPLEPLQPGEEVVLRLRPRAAAGGDFAEIRIQAASSAVLNQHRQRLSALQADPSRWAAAINGQLSSNPALAIALAGDPLAPPDLLKAAATAVHCGSN